MKKRSSKRQAKNIVVVCHNIRSAGNVGAIFRTADAVGVTKIILGGYSAQPPHPKLLKVSLGAEKTIPYKRVWPTWRAIEKLKQDGYQVVALEKTKKAGNLFNFKPRYPLALVVGNEVGGLSKAIRRRCHNTVFIPMRGQKESLNVAVAFGVAVYQLAK